MIKYILSVLLLFLSFDKSNSQVKQEWVQRFGDQINDIPEVECIAVDNKGNVFVSGSLRGSTLTDFLTVKYNSSGEMQWSGIFTGLIEDRVIDMKLDEAGNIYVTGLSENQTGTYDIITIKYNTAGDSLWVRRYNGATAFTMDQPVAMYIDNSNNVYVCGYSFGSTPMNYVTIKYSPQGDSLWVARYIIGGTLLPRDLYVDDTGNVYVYGRGATVLKYDPDGNLLWNRTYDIDGSETNRAITGDGSGNLFLGGTKFTSTFDDFAVLKINPSGDLFWSGIYNGLGNQNTNHDDLYAITSDNSSNVFITGKSYDLVLSYFSTIKYDSDGIFQWERIYSNPENGEGGRDIVTDNSGNIYVTGGSNDFTTIKYNTNGDSLWKITYNGPSNLNDFATSLAIDNTGNIYVTGRSRLPGSPLKYEMATLKYTQTITGIQSVDLPQHFTLNQNYPNPFNPTTNLEFGISDRGYVLLKIYDVPGKEIATLVNEKLDPGKYVVQFEGSNLPSGVYFYELKIKTKAGVFSGVKRMLLLK